MRWWLCVAQCCFNPRPCVRGDNLRVAFFDAVLLFQSTPLCEGRQAITAVVHGDPLFQSTPLCEGRR